MKTLIIEDERPIALSMKNLLKKLRPSIEIAGITTSISDSIQCISKNPDLDIIFSDIRIDDGLSFSIFDTIETKALVVFTTAYDEYALKAFDFNCIDYLLKPIEEEQLEKALSKCESFCSRLSSPDLNKACKAIVDNTIRYRSRVFLERGQDTLICNVNDVCYFSIDNGITRGFLNNGTWGDISYSLTELIDSLDPNLFFRISRQVLVNVNYIAKIKQNFGRGFQIYLSEPYSRTSLNLSLDRRRDLLRMLE